MTIVERADALIVTAPFLPRKRAAVLVVATIVAFAFLATFGFGGPGPRQAIDVIGMAVVFGIGGYLALLLAFDRTVTTVRHDRIVVRRGPVPMWPAVTIDATLIEDVYARVVTGFAGRGGRTAMDTVAASLAGGRIATLIDDAGDTADAEDVAATIAAWLAGAEPSS